MAATTIKRSSLFLVGAIFALLAMTAIAGSSTSDTTGRKLMQGDMPSGALPGGKMPDMGNGGMPGGKMGEGPGGKKPVLNCAGTCARCKQNPCKSLDCTNNAQVCEGCKMRWGMDCQYCKSKTNKCKQAASLG